MQNLHKSETRLTTKPIFDSWGDSQAGIRSRGCSRDVKFTKEIVELGGRGMLRSDPVEACPEDVPPAISRQLWKAPESTTQGRESRMDRF